MLMNNGRGNILHDEDGRAWLDMLSGILNVSLGHGSQPVLDALKEVEFTGLVNTYDRPSVNSSLLKFKLLAYNDLYSWQLLNTGAEAIERAIQVVSTLLGRRPVVAVLPDSFHGKSITMAGIRYDVAWGNPFEVITLTGPDDERDFDVLIYEPISGWSGKCWSEGTVHRMCQARDAFMVADEMITGFMRCGERFMSTHADMIVSGKGLAQGCPLAVLGIRGGISDKLPIGWNTTAGGNNLSATIGLHVIRHLQANERDLKKRIRHIQQKLGTRYRMFGCLGFLEHDMDPEAVRAVFEKNRVIVSWHDQHIRIAPSFYTTDEELNKLLQVTEEALCL